MSMKKVAVIMGSNSDLPVLKGAFDTRGSWRFPLRRMYIPHIALLRRRRPLPRRRRRTASAC